MLPPRTLPPEEIASNVASIADVPAAVLPPDGLPRAVLMVLAAKGYDVYAYASGGPTLGTWVVWLQPLAERHVDRDGRVPISEWCQRWRELLVAMGMGVRAAGDR